MTQHALGQMQRPWPQTCPQLQATIQAGHPPPHLRLTPSLLMTTVRMQPPLLPSRAMAWLTAFTTNAWHSSSVMLGCGNKGRGQGGGKQCTALWAGDQPASTL